jgi:hypothetical protein
MSLSGKDEQELTSRRVRIVADAKQLEALRFAPQQCFVRCERSGVVKAGLLPIATDSRRVPAGAALQESMGGSGYR